MPQQTCTSNSGFVLWALSLLLSASRSQVLAVRYYTNIFKFRKCLFHLIVTEKDEDHFPRYLINSNPIFEIIAQLSASKIQVNVSLISTVHNFDIFQSLCWFNIFKSMPAIWGNIQNTFSIILCGLNIRPCYLCSLTLSNRDVVKDLPKDHGHLGTEWCNKKDFLNAGSFSLCCSEKQVYAHVGFLWIFKAHLRLYNMIMTALMSPSAVFGHIQINIWYYFENDTLILKICLAIYKWD